MKIKVLSCMVLTLSLISTVLYAASLYTITDLGALRPRIDAHEFDMNNRGQVVGTGLSHYLWEDGVKKNLGMPPGFNVWSVRSINDKGEIAGTLGNAGVPGIPEAYYAFIWRKGIFTALRNTKLGYSMGVRINNRGQLLIGSGDKAYIWDNKTVTPLRVPCGFTWIFTHAINDKAEVAGTVAVGDDRRGFIWKKGHYWLFPKTGTSSISDVNNHGVAVGSHRNTSNVSYAVVWQNGKVRYLKTPQGMGSAGATAINNKGQIVGSAATPSSPYTTVVLWEDDTVVDLQDLIPQGSGWDLEWPDAMNDKGQIVGQGRYNGSHHAFLLTPIK